jgi:hypothetical protein
MAIVFYLKGNHFKAKYYIDRAKTLEPLLTKDMSGINELEKKGYYWTERDKVTLKKMFEELK